MGYAEKAVRAFTFITLIVSNIAVILSNRSWSDSIFKIIMTPNKTVKWIVGGAVLFLLLIVNIPALQNLFLFDKIGWLELGICTLAGLSTIIWFELYKHFKRII